MRVVEEPHVGDKVGVLRQPVLEPERDDVDGERGVLLAHLAHDEVAQFVDIEVARVDDGVRALAHGGQQLALTRDALEQSAVLLERMRAARLLEPVYECVVGRVEEHQAHGHAALLEVVDHRLDVREQPARAHIDHGGEAISGILADHRDEPAEHLRRDVIDHVPALIRECGGGARAAGARHPGEDDHLCGGFRRFEFGHRNARGERDCWNLVRHVSSMPGAASSS